MLAQHAVEHHEDVARLRARVQQRPARAERAHLEATQQRLEVGVLERRDRPEGGGDPSSLRWRSARSSACGAAPAPPPGSRGRCASGSRRSRGRSRRASARARPSPRRSRCARDSGARPAASGTRPRASPPGCRTRADAAACRPARRPARCARRRPDRSAASCAAAPLLRPVVVSSPTGAPPRNFAPSRPPEALNTQVFATDISFMKGLMRRSSASVERRIGSAMASSGARSRMIPCRGRAQENP